MSEEKVTYVGGNGDCSDVTSCGLVESTNVLQKRYAPFFRRTGVGIWGEGGEVPE
jgi:hypothetical protein